jgi:hypothetical protein
MTISHAERLLARRAKRNARQRKKRPLSTAQAGRLGGIARMEALSVSRRKEIAGKGGRARWDAQRAREEAAKVSAPPAENNA